MRQCTRARNTGSARGRGHRCTVYFRFGWRRIDGTPVVDVVSRDRRPATVYDRRFAERTTRGGTRRIAATRNPKSRQPLFDAATIAMARNDGAPRRSRITFLSALTRLRLLFRHSTKRNTARDVQAHARTGHAEWRRHSRLIGGYIHSVPSAPKCRPPIFTSLRRTCSTLARRSSSVIPMSRDPREDRAPIPGDLRRDRRRATRFHYRSYESRGNPSDLRRGRLEN